MVFGQTLHHEFVNLDDEDYVYENPTVSRGLTSYGITWAFTHTYASNWHPLTWISHMLDCQLYGLNPGGHHLTSVLLHAATAILLFLVLRQMTGALWASAFVAAVFAIHPLRVESVAWVSERKDVLSGLFFMLTLAAYVRYARGTFSPGRYLMVVLCFAMGLMAKPMLVTLPFVLLLLDYWPLGRMLRTALRPLVVEKIPLLVLSIASCAVTIPAQGEAVAPISRVPIALRLGNAAISYVAYLGQMVFPDTARACLPTLRRRVDHMENRFGIGFPGGRLHGSHLAATESSLFIGRLAVVCGNAGSGDRTRTSGKSGAGGSVHVSAADWRLFACGVGGTRCTLFPAARPLDIGRRFAERDRRPDGVCDDTNIVLAQQHVNVDPRALLHVPELRSP